MPRRLSDAATRSQVYLERLKAGFVRDYGRAQIELRKNVVGVLAMLEEDNLSQLSRAKLRTVLAELQAAQVSTTGAAMSSLLQSLEPLAGYIAGSEALTLASVVKTRFAAPTANLAYERALLEPVHATGQLLESFTKDWTIDEAARVANVVRKGWAEGQTVSQAVRSLRGTAGRRYKDGQLAMTERKAAAVINTATQHVSSAARMAVYEENDDLVTGYKFVATLDGQTTPICRSLDGRVFQPGKGPLPPMHVNCRSTTVPELSDEFDFLDAGAKRASYQGPVDASQTYYEWLRTQSEDFQNDALGPRRGQLMRDGGLSSAEFARLNLGRDFEPLTLAEMREMNPEAFKRAGL